MTASEPSKRESKNAFGNSPLDSEAKLNILLILKQKKKEYAQTQDSSNKGAKFLIMSLAPAHGEKHCLCCISRLV